MHVMEVDSQLNVYFLQHGESQAGILLFQWRLLGMLLRRGRQVDRLLQRDGRLLSGLGQQLRQQGFSGHGHGGFVAVSDFRWCDFYLVCFNLIFIFVACIFSSVGCVIRKDLWTYSDGRGVTALSSESTSSSSVSGFEAGGGVKVKIICTVIRK